MTRFEGRFFSHCDLVRHILTEKRFCEGPALAWDSDAKGIRGVEMSKRTILLVDDNPKDEALMVRVLNKSRTAHDMVVVRDGVEALHYLFGSGSDNGPGEAGLPSVVLLDLKLPRIDGLEVLRRIRSDSRTRLLPVVILTSSDEERDIVSSYEGGANSYVRKPVAYSAFNEVLAVLGRYWLAVNEPPPTERK